MPADYTAPTRRVAFPVERVRRPSGMMLRVLDGDDAPLNITLDTPVATVGRGRVADLTVRERSISAVHFELRASSSGVELRDLDSTNGVWFHDRRVTTVALQDGDMFRAGQCRFLLTGVEDVDVELLATDKFGRLYGSSLAMRELYTQLDRLGPTPLGVLLLGETGTGKELAARTIHALSGRRGPLVVLDCGALSPTLIEATIFGFRKGSFTGADRDQTGVFEAANGGTLFIDEVGELAPELQVKLLRTLEDSRITRVGEPTPSLEVDVRVVAATHRDLRLAVAEGRFREDLYYRLAQAIVRSPPLRERGDDILMLAQVFLREVCDERGVTITITDEAAKAMRAHPWPGNVRELRNTVRQAAYLSRDGAITRADLHLGDRQLLRPDRIEDMLRAGASYAEIHTAVDELILPRLLEAHDHNLSSLAKALGKSRDTVRKMLRQVGLHS